MICRLTGLVGGIDEAGRGPLAGPVVSACVIWERAPEDKNGVTDSKLLTQKERVGLFSWIMDNALSVGIGMASREEIDEMNILKASLLSMERALLATGMEPDVVLVDGNRGLRNYPNARPVVRGDRRCFFMASASIVAKVIRDRAMDAYHRIYPNYNFKQNKGYPTREHKAAIREFGITPIHRVTFKGVREYCAG
ncbi:MAG TPA: ribonuclease HII [Syntrophorhabdaceae bacterium]|nr:ribonuclease HII [Syntrophorhabdaceae bacterium]HOD75341.1 ribonuclease HII [Syntrophorhabdaceae bacterium]